MNEPKPPEKPLHQRMADHWADVLRERRWNFTLTHEPHQSVVNVSYVHPDSRPHETIHRGNLLHVLWDSIVGYQSRWHQVEAVIPHAVDSTQASFTFKPPHSPKGSV